MQLKLFSALCEQLLCKHALRLSHSVPKHACMDAIIIFSYSEGKFLSDTCERVMSLQYQASFDLVVILAGNTHSLMWHSWHTHCKLTFIKQSNLMPSLAHEWLSSRFLRLHNQSRRKNTLNWWNSHHIYANSDDGTTTPHPLSSLSKVVSM